MSASRLRYFHALVWGLAALGLFSAALIAFQDRNTRIREPDSSLELAAEVAAARRRVELAKVELEREPGITATRDTQITDAEPIEPPRRTALGSYLAAEAQARTAAARWVEHVAGSGKERHTESDTQAEAGENRKPTLSNETFEAEFDSKPALTTEVSIWQQSSEGMKSTSGSEQMVAERLRQVREQMAPARLNYTRPTNLAVGEEKRILAAVVPLLEIDEQSANRGLGTSMQQAQDKSKQVSIEASSVMLAALIGSHDAFHIQPQHHSERQALLPDRPTEWEWQVRALRPGLYDLTLVLTAVVRLDDREELLTRTYPDRIQVRVDPVITGAYLVRRYWLPLLTLLLAALLAIGGNSTRRYWLKRQKRILQAAMAVADPAPGKGYIFISYSRRDEGFAIPLASQLMLQGIRVWLDQREIRAGEDWVEHIMRGIARTDAMLVVLSPNALSSPHVAKEIEAALAANKPIFPVFHRRCQPPDPLARINAIDFTQDEETALERLAADIRAHGF